MQGVIRKDGQTDDGVVEYDLSFPSLRAFVSEFAGYLSHDGLFIPAEPPDPPSTVVQFRIMLPDGFILLEGTGVVLWSRRREEAPLLDPGMAIRFATLGPQSQELIDQLVSRHIDEGGSPFELEAGYQALGMDAAQSEVPAVAAAEDGSSPTGGPEKPQRQDEGVRFQVREATVRRPSPQEQPPPPREHVSRPARVGVLPVMPASALQEFLPDDHEPEAARESGETYVSFELEDELGPGETFELVPGEMEGVGPATGAASGSAGPGERAPRAEADQPLSAPVPAGDTPPVPTDALRPGVPPGVRASDHEPEVTPSRPSTAPGDDLQLGEMPRGGEGVSPQEVSSSVSDRDPETDVAAQLAPESRGVLDGEGTDGEVPVPGGAVAGVPPGGPAYDHGPGEEDGAGGEIPTAVDTLSEVGDVEDELSAPDEADEEERARELEHLAVAPEFSFSVGHDTGEEDDTPSIGQDTPFDVSFPMEDVGPDTTPFSEFAGTVPEVTLVSTDEEEGGEPAFAARRGRLRLFTTVLVVAAIALGYTNRGRLLELAQPFLPAQGQPAEAEKPADDAVGATLMAESAAGAGAQTGTDAAPLVATQDDPSSTVGVVQPTRRPAGGSAATGSVSGETTPENGATAIQEISWRQIDDRTVVVVRGNRQIARAAVAVITMNSPPRVLVRVRGITRPYARHTIEVGSPELRTIRVGHHPEQNPPSLYIVLDRGNPDILIVHEEIEGDSIRVTLGEGSSAKGE